MVTTQNLNELQGALNQAANDVRQQRLHDQVGPSCQAAEVRQTARGLLLQRAAHLRREAQELEDLARGLPLEMTPSAERAMSKLVTTAFNRS